jgi:tetratricopeptide (TPR) repeat protein
MGRGVCGFDQHLRTQPRDALALFLLWYWLEVPVIRLLATSDAQKYALLNEELSRFWFVGSYQYCDELIAAIAPDLDVPPAARRTNTTPGWQRRVDWRPLQEDELPDATRQEILSRNPMHVALWETWRDARFAAAGVHPKPLPAAHRSSLGWRELLRAGLTDRLIWMREFEARRPWEEAARASRAGDWRRAVSLYRKALDQAPGFPDVWVQYGHALCEAGDIAAAETAYRRALELDDGLAAAALSLGGVLQQQGRIEEARDAFRRFERLDPAALGRMAEGLVAAGWEPEAVAAHWRALTGDAQADAPA